MGDARWRASINNYPSHLIAGAEVSQAVIFGQMAGKCAARAILEGDQNILSEYELKWRDYQILLGRIQGVLCKGLMRD